MTEYTKPWLWKAPEGGSIGKKRLRSQDGFEKASGRGIFTRDIYLPGMIYAKPFECPYPNAKIKSMDTSQAEALPGVRAVIRYDDPSIDWPLVVGAPFASASVYKPYPLLAGEGRTQGQAVGAIVVADSELICDEALRLVGKDIEWEILPFFVGLDDEPLQPSFPLIFPDWNPESNLGQEIVEEQGNVETGLAEAPNVIDITFTYEPDVWAGVEGQCTVADWKGENYFEIWRHGQGGAQILRKMTGIPGVKLNLESAEALCHIPYNGGTFGNTQNWASEWNTYMAILASRITGKPVKSLWDYGTHFFTCGEELGTYNMKIGFKNNGEITAIKYHTFLVSAVKDHLNKIQKGSKVENLYITKTYPWQNHGEYQCYKHGGAPCLCHIEPFNQVAAALDMDPTEVALVNDGCYGHDMAWVNENVKAEQGFDPTRDSLREVLAIGKEAIDWENKWHKPGTKILPNGNYHGIGFVWMITWAHVGDTSDPGPCVGLQLKSDGAVSMVGHWVDNGVGGASAYCSIVADELGIKYEDIFLSHKDYSGFYLATGVSSNATATNAPRLVVAARNLKKLILEAAVKERSGRMGVQPPFFPDKTPEELDLWNSEIFEKANPDNKIPLATFASSFKPFAWNYDQPLIPEKTYAMGRQCYFQEVEVDPDTGKVYVKKMVAVNDIGKLIYPEAHEGQQYGGLYMGEGSSNTEQVLYDPQTGVKLTDNLIAYDIALVNDIDSIECYDVETGLGYSAYGLMGCSESPKACTVGLTRYAVHNAIGKWVDIKTTPEKILKALGKI